MCDGAIAGWIFTHSLAENDDDTQMYDNLLKFYVYSKNRNTVFRKPKSRSFVKKIKIYLPKINKIIKYVK
jgi:hypothetical protein